MAREKTTIMLDRARAELARELVHADSVSEVIDIALARLIFDAKVEHDVVAYRAHPQTPGETSVLAAPWPKLDDDDFDWEGFYANRSRRRAAAR